MATSAPATDKSNDELNAVAAGNPLRAVWRRILNRQKSPRKWWWPKEGEPETEDAAGSYQDQHDEASKTIRRVMLTLVGYSFFCMLTLSTPDVTLLANNNKIKIPFAQTDIEFIDFLIVGPLVLMALVAYMHIFIAFWSHIPKRYVPKPLPFIFNMQGMVSKTLAALLFYWLAPLILFLFAWKAQPHFPGDTALFCLATGVTAIMLWLQIRTYPEETRKRPRYRGLWIALFVFAAIAVKLGLPLTGKAIDLTVVAAKSVATPILAELGFGPDAPIQVAVLPSTDPQPVQPSTRPSVDRPTNETKAKPINKESASNISTEQEIRKAQLIKDSPQLRGLSRSLNLAGANLTKVDLSGKDFKKANLRNANLSGNKIGHLANDKWFDFDFANMRGANLNRTDSQYVSFYGANLLEANFTNSKFRAVVFAEASLRGADFTGVEFFGGINLNRSDLRGVIGLDCATLKQSFNFHLAYRDQKLACGKPIPPPPAAEK